MSPGTVIVHIVDPSAISPEQALASITEEEIARANQFRFAPDATRWISFRAQLRLILGNALSLPPTDVPILTGSQGKPLLAPPHSDLHFNLSHCSDLGLVALCHDGPVGIDLESLGRAEDLLECETMFCHPAEIEILPETSPARASRLLEIWTAKEAILKALGTGLASQPELLKMKWSDSTAAAETDHLFPGIGDQKILRLHHPRLVAHLAVVSVPNSVKCVEFAEE